MSSGFKIKLIATQPYKGCMYSTNLTLACRDSHVFTDFFSHASTLACVSCETRVFGNCTLIY